MRGLLPASSMRGSKGLGGVKRHLRCAVTSSTSAPRWARVRNARARGGGGAAQVAVEGGEAQRPRREVGGGRVAATGGEEAGELGGQGGGAHSPVEREEGDAPGGPDEHRREPVGGAGRGGVGKRLGDLQLGGRGGGGGGAARGWRRGRGLGPPPPPSRR